jgi:hypothetical protein
MNELTTIEKQIMHALLAGEDGMLSILREQLRFARVSARKMSGVGFFTTFQIPSEVVRITECSTFKLGDVNGDALNVKHGIGFLLYVKNGALDALEGYTYDEPWPPELESLSLTYSEGKSRNMDKLRKILRGC